jgi:hypothetical protein
MLKRILSIAALLGTVALGGCATAVQPALDRYHVVLAPDSLYNCPQVKKYPSIKTLTDLQTARILLEQAENLKICASSMAALKAYYAKAKRDFEMANPGQKVGA